MSHSRKISFTGPAARLQYAILMTLFRFAPSRGFYGASARGLGRIFGTKNAAFLHLCGAAPFKIYLNDGYWTRFALYRDDYEPEVAAILAAASGASDLFCDLGANKGYWTVQAAALFPDVRAVEAASDTFEALRENTAALPNVTLFKAAIHASSDQTMTFVNVPLSHASARLEDVGAPTPNAPSETVQTLAIDDLVPDGAAALIKLDVEGAEIAAFEGARAALRNGSVFIYEDHGSDDTCAPSRYLLDQPDIGLYSCENHIKRLNSIEEIHALKVDRFKGYNFLAARKNSPLLSAILEGFAKAQR